MHIHPSWHKNKGSSRKSVERGLDFFKKKSGRLPPSKKVALTPKFRQIQVTREEPRKRMSAMTNIVEQLFKSLDPWTGFQITSFKIQVSPVDGRKTLILDLRPVEGSMPICSRCRHEAPLVHGYVSRRIKECSLLGLFRGTCG